MRRLIAMLALAGCAQTGIPPGGPPDRNPPILIRVTPDTNAVNVRPGAIAFQFDEVVSERPQGVPTLVDLFVISPSLGPASVSWRRSRVEITPRGGLRPNTTYTVRMLPGLVDLDNNMDSTGLTLVFSTGAALATGRISGRAFDWVAARPAVRAVVEAISLPDSARYATESDSVGLFEITHMPPGRFLLRAHMDQNRNRIVDNRELFDSITVTLTDSLRREMLAAVRDSLGPGIAAVDVRDSLMVRVSFDRPLDTLFVPRRAAFAIRGADSADVAIDTVLVQADLDRMAADTARTRAIQDSVRAAAAADSIRAADTTRAVTTPPAQPTRPTGRRPGAATRAPTAAPPDTSDRIVPKPAAKVPITVVFLRLPRRLQPNSQYRVTAQDIVSITGATRSSQRIITTPRPTPADTGAVRPDTGRRLP